jgi:hypothetical protein
MVSVVIVVPLVRNGVVTKPYQRPAMTAAEVNWLACA